MGPQRDSGKILHRGYNLIGYYIIDILGDLIHGNIRYDGGSLIGSDIDICMK